MPLRAEALDALRDHLSNLMPNAPAFHMPDSPAKMLRQDLEAARNNWIEEAETDPIQAERKRLSFLRYRTVEGVADFHSLRHTFITNLARGGVHPRLAQDLARHSDINLTLSRYTHTLLGERAKALAALPDLSKDNTEAMRKTGTDGKTAGKPTAVFPSCFPEFQRLEANSVDSGGLRGDEPEDAQTPAQQESPPFSATKSTKPPNGLEPLTCGLQNRCSAN